MANGHIPTKDFRWPEPRGYSVPKDAGKLIDELRRDRNELLAALEEEHPTTQGHEPRFCPVCALLARAKSS